MTKDSSAKRKTGKRKPEKLSFTQDFIPIKNLEHGIIETTDGRYIKILEIEPINFMLRSEEEQYEIICSFASWLKISPVHLQFKSITRKADSDKHIAMLRKEMATEESEQCKKLSEGYIRLIKDVGSREALTRRFFLIFRYEELRRNENSDYGQICSTLLTAEQNARAYFMQCGNNILQPKDPDEAMAAPSPWRASTTPTASPTRKRPRRWPGMSGTPSATGSGCCWPTGIPILKRITPPLGRI